MYNNNKRIIIIIIILFCSEYVITRYVYYINNYKTIIGRGTFLHHNWESQRHNYSNINKLVCIHADLYSERS